MKKALLAVAVVALSSGVALTHAGDKKHLYVNVNAPVYRGAPPAYHGGYYQAPRYGYSGGYYGRGGYGHGHGGYWRNGRWIAPVVVGATLGALAISASTPVYASPPPVYYAPPVNHYAPVDRFSAADLNNDEYLSYYEARRYGNLHRNFRAIDWNGDGYLSRDEVNAWRYHW